jgi:hypothetical protein
VTIDEVLLEWFPHLFESKDKIIQPRCKVFVQGIKVPLDESTVLDLWRGLSHPDRFLYIIVISNNYLAS